MNKLRILLTQIIIFSTILSGCIDDPVIQNGTVTGTIYGKYGMPNPYTLVSIEDYPIIGVDLLGNFSIDNNVIPYDLTFGNNYQSATKYVGLSNSQLRLFAFNDYGSIGSCQVTVKFPFIPVNNYVYIKFISNDNFMHFTEFATEDTSLTMEVGIMPDKDKIEGRLIFLKYRYGSSIKYDNFGIKNITLYRGSHTNPPIVFTPADISYNPPEVNMLYTIQTSGYYRRMDNDAYLNFPGMNFNSSMQLPYFYGQYSTGYFQIPLLPELNYNIKFKNYIDFSFDSTYTFSEKWLFVNPGENVFMQHEESIKLMSPSEEYWYVTDNTKFEFTDTEPGGIYVFRFYRFIFESDLDLTVITDKHSLEFKDIKSRGVTFMRDKKYYWNVRKYPGYKNIDEFAARNVVKDTIYNSIPSSTTRRFMLR